MIIIIYCYHYYIRHNHNNQDSIYHNYMCILT